MLIGWQNIYTNDASHLTQSPMSAMWMGKPQKKVFQTPTTNATAGAAPAVHKTLITFLFLVFFLFLSLSPSCSFAMNNQKLEML